MSENTKKEHKCSHHTRGSRWHTFHFSGKLILCSVIFGLLLVLVGGILLAIGMDKDEDTKSNNYEDLQKKPPLVFVGSVIMGIGGFTVIVGILMCLVETKVLRGRTADANPLINGEGGESGIKDSETSEPTAIPSTSHQRETHRHGHRKKSPSPRTKNGKKTYSSKSHSKKEISSPNQPSSGPIDTSGKNSNNLLSASDKFMTPYGSFVQENMQLQTSSRNAVNPIPTSAIKSLTSSSKSWNTSTEFQTPSTSFNDNSITFESSQESNEMSTSDSVRSIPNSPIVKELEKKKHAFLTPLNSNAGILDSTSSKVEELEKVKHEYLTPINSNAEILESSSDNENVLDQKEHEYLTPKNSNSEILESSSNTSETLKKEANENTVSDTNAEQTVPDPSHRTITGQKFLENSSIISDAAQNQGILNQESSKLGNILDHETKGQTNSQEDTERHSSILDSAQDSFASNAQNNSDKMHTEIGKNNETEFAESEQKTIEEERTLGLSFDSAKSEEKEVNKDSVLEKESEEIICDTSHENLQNDEQCDTSNVEGESGLNDDTVNNDCENKDEFQNND